MNWIRLANVPVIGRLAAVAATGLVLGGRSARACDGVYNNLGAESTCTNFGFSSCTQFVTTCEYDYCLSDTCGSGFILFCIDSGLVCQGPYLGCNNLC